MTREEGARLLGVAVQTIKNYEKRNLLHPLRALRRDVMGREHQVMVHDPRQLVRVREALRAESKNEVPDTSTWLTRNESVDLLSVSTQTLKNYESRGLLHPLRVPRRDARGHEQSVVVYDPKELSRLQRGNGKPFAFRDPKEINARCYELFEQGKTNREIVIELREASDTVRELRDKWLDDGGAKIVISPEAKIALEKALGPFEDVTELVDRVTSKIKPT